MNSIQMKGICLLSMLMAAATITAQAETAQGVVFHDRNGDGAQDSGEAGLPSVSVSNGVDVVQTGADGSFTIAVTEDCSIFVVKPSGWQFPLNAGTRTAKSYYLHKPAGSPKLKVPGVEPTGPLPEKLYFGLTPQDESGVFEMLAFGDTQPRDQREIDFISHGVVEELLDSSAELGVVLGDIVFNNVSDLSSLAHSVGLIPVPWYYVIGNHDLNFDAPDPVYIDETFEQVFGPSYYAFNYGNVHFVVLNNVAWDVQAREYHGGLGDTQLKFMENDLQFVPKDKLLVIMMHIPLMDVEDKDKMFELVKDYPHTFSISAHWHRQGHFFLDQSHGWGQPNPHHHLVQGTVCGSWWTGGFDELGIPHATMSDGVPNGYSVISFSGNEYSIRYKAARRPADYQMNIFTPEIVARGALAETEVIVNVFSGSERDQVEMRVGAASFAPMTRFEGPDPFVVKNKERERAMATLIAKGAGIENPDEDALKDALNKNLEVTGRSLPGTQDTGHVWKGMLPGGLEAGYHVVEVKWTDQFGQTSMDKRIFRVE